MAMLVCPLRAPFLVDKNSKEPQRFEDLSHHRTIVHFSFRFYSILVWSFFGHTAGNTLVRYYPFISVLANAENLTGIAKLAIGLVVESIPLQGARGDACETKLRQFLFQGCVICDANLDLCLHRLHRPESIPAGTTWENGTRKSEQKEDNAPCGRRE